MFSVGLLELLEGALFAIEELDHAHAAHVFLGVCVDLGDRRADQAIAPTNGNTKQPRDVHDHRQHCERQQGQRPAHAQHNGHNEDEHKHVFKDGEHARGKHFVQRVHITRETKRPTGFLS